MFSPELFYKPPVSKSLSLSVGGNILFGTSTTTKAKCYHFTASQTTPQELILHLYNALNILGFKEENSKDHIIRTAVIESTLLTVKGVIGMSIQVFELTPQLCLLEIRKGKGDILEWTNAYHDLIDNH